MNQLYLRLCRFLTAAILLFAPYAAAAHPTDSIAANDTLTAKALLCQADSLHKLHRYDEAKTAYERFFRQAAQEGLYDEANVEKSDSICGPALYNYAFNTLFQSDEKEGKNLLGLAAKTGYEPAKAAWDVLLNNPIFTCKLKIKKKVKKHFDEIFANHINDSTARAAMKSAQFWQYIRRYNPDYQELLEAQTRQRLPGSLKSALKAIKDKRSTLLHRLMVCNAHTDSLTDRIMDSTICLNDSLLQAINVYKAEKPAIFTTSYGEMYITDAMLERMNFNSDLLTAVLAHETNHWALQHLLTNLWTVKKRQKKAAIFGGLAAGLLAATGTLLVPLPGGNGYDKSGLLMTPAFTSIPEDTYYFQFNYDIEQELEADLNAYRFCEAAGIGGYAYIIALELLPDQVFSKSASIYSGHPHPDYRVGFLKYLYAKEHPESAIAQVLKEAEKE